MVHAGQRLNCEPLRLQAIFATPIEAVRVLVTRESFQAHQLWIWCRKFEKTVTTVYLRYGYTAMCIYSNYWLAVAGICDDRKQKSLPKKIQRIVRYKKNVPLNN